MLKSPEHNLLDGDSDLYQGTTLIFTVSRGRKRRDLKFHKIIEQVGSAEYRIAYSYISVISCLV